MAMLLGPSTRSGFFLDGDMDEFYQQAKQIAKHRHLSVSSDSKAQSISHNASNPSRPNAAMFDRTPIRRKRASKSLSAASASLSTASTPFRLADLAKEHIMGRHVENWREDTLGYRHHLPLQQIVGSLKLEREDSVRTRRENVHSHPNFTNPAYGQHNAHVESSTRHDILTPASSEDSFSEPLKTPSPISQIDTYQGPKSYLDIEYAQLFSNQTEEALAKDRRQSHPTDVSRIALDAADMTRKKRDLPSDSAVHDLSEDNQVLTDEVVRMRDPVLLDGASTFAEESHFFHSHDHQSTRTPGCNGTTANINEFDEFLDFSMH